MNVAETEGDVDISCGVDVTFCCGEVQLALTLAFGFGFMLMFDDGVVGVVVVVPSAAGGGGGS